MATVEERILNRRSQRGRLPAWSRPALFLVPMWAAAILLFWAMYWARPDSFQYWNAWAWTLYGVLMAVALWFGRITTIDVGSDVLAVRRPVRSRAAAMNDVLRVDAHRVPWRIVATRQPPLYRIDIWLTGFRHWRLDNIEPEAGDRLLATLHAHQKPVWVFASS